MVETATRKRGVSQIPDGFDPHQLVSPAGSQSETSSILPKPVQLSLEVTLSRPVKYKGKHRTMQGRTDYALFNGKEGDDLGSSLAIEEARRLGHCDNELPQALAYMGKSALQLLPFFLPS